MVTAKEIESMSAGEFEKLCVRLNVDFVMARVVEGKWKVVIHTLAGRTFEVREREMLEAMAKALTSVEGVIS